MTDIPAINFHEAYTELPPLDAREEGKEAYTNGGFHPAHLGEVYNEKYRILRKLGWGCYSTVWLVEDLTIEGPTDTPTDPYGVHPKDRKYKALKILSAAYYNGGRAALYEKETLKDLLEKNPHHEGYPYILPLIETFVHEGPVGKHMCLVFPVLGESLQTFCTWFTDYRVPDALMRRITKQLLLALQYAHSVGVIHCDIKPDNILIQINSDSFIANYYLPEHPAEFNPQRDTWTIQSQPIPLDFLADRANFRHFHITLADWGLSSWAKDHTDHVIQPAFYRAPEVMIGARWTTNTDLWNLGAVIFELSNDRRMFSGDLFPGGAEGFSYSVREHLFQIVETFGPFDQDFLDDGVRGMTHTYFDECGRIKGIRNPPEIPLLESEKRMPGLKEEERKRFGSFLRELMKINPKERKSIDELLAHEWVTIDLSEDETLIDAAPDAEFDFAEQVREELERMTLEDK